MFAVFGRDAVQAPGQAVRWSPSVGEGARAGTRPAPTAIRWDWPDVVWPDTFDWAPFADRDTRSARHVVGEGALRGRSPRTREGRIGPTAQKSSG